MVVGKVPDTFRSLCLPVQDGVVPALNRNHKWSWHYLKPQDPVEFFYLTEWSYLNCLCKMKSWSWGCSYWRSQVHILGNVSLRLMCWCPPSLTPAPSTGAACLLLPSLWTDLRLSGKELATSWALHNLPASEKRGFPPTYFQQRIRDNEVLPLEYHLDF